MDKWEGSLRVSSVSESDSPIINNTICPKNSLAFSRGTRNVHAPNNNQHHTPEHPGRETSPWPIERTVVLFPRPADNGDLGNRDAGRGTAMFVPRIFPARFNPPLKHMNCISGRNIHQRRQVIPYPPEVLYTSLVSHWPAVYGERTMQGGWVEGVQERC